MLLSVRNVTKEFPVGRGFWGNPRAFLKAVDGVSLGIAAGERVGLVGESGCGKSTLGRGILALAPFTRGEVEWEGRVLSAIPPAELRRRRRDFQMVFQNPMTALNPRHRVRRILTEPLRVQGEMGEDPEGKAARMLERVGLAASDLAKHPHEFSGGQRQRIGLARAMMLKPKLIVLDEPVSSLDVSVQASILNLLMELNRGEGTAYFFISHDLNVVGYLCQRILVMYLGRIVESGQVAEVLRAPKHPYTQALLRAGKGSGEGRGEAPEGGRSVGCPFRPRCPIAEEKCGGEAPPLVEWAPGWQAACWKAGEKA